MNRVDLIGRLTTDPFMSNTRNTNTRVAHFTLAVDSRREDKTDFIRIVSYGKTAEFVEKYITKGQRIGLSGKINTYNYTDRNNIKRYGFDVTAYSIFFADSKKEIRESDTNPASVESINKQFEEFTMDEISGRPDNDLPF